MTSDILVRRLAAGEPPADLFGECLAAGDFKHAMRLFDGLPQPRRPLRRVAVELARIAVRTADELIEAIGGPEDPSDPTYRNLVDAALVQGESSACGREDTAALRADGGEAHFASLYYSYLMENDGGEPDTDPRGVRAFALHACGFACTVETPERADRVWDTVYRTWDTADSLVGMLDERRNPAARKEPRRRAGVLGCDLLAYVVGNPFRPTPVHADADTREMARQLEIDGDAVTLAALADKQEENGRTAAADILRSRQYMKGCCVVRHLLESD